MPRRQSFGPHGRGTGFALRSPLSILSLSLSLTLARSLSLSGYHSVSLSRVSLVTRRPSISSPRVPGSCSRYRDRARALAPGPLQFRVSEQSSRERNSRWIVHDGMAHRLLLRGGCHAAVGLGSHPTRGARWHVYSPLDLQRWWRWVRWWCH